METTMINVALLKLTENDKRIIFVLLAVFILLLVLIAYIGYLVTIVMRWQGKKINNYVTDPVVNGVITNEKDFKRYAKKKNILVFYHQARIPALILVAGVIFYVIASSIVGWVNPFNYENGFGTLFFIWDFSKIITKPESGVGILLNWPELINRPHFVQEAWVSYAFVPIAFIGGIWYLLTVQAFIARALQINKLAQKIFTEQIENFTYQGQNNPPQSEDNNNQQE